MEENNRNRYTKEDDALIIRTDVAMKLIARKLNRSFGAIKSRRYILVRMSKGNDIVQERRERYVRNAPRIREHMRKYRQKIKEGNK